MAEINVSRWLLGGVVAGIVIWLLEGVGGSWNEYVGDKDREDEVFVALSK